MDCKWGYSDGGLLRVPDGDPTGHNLPRPVSETFTSWTILFVSIYPPLTSHLTYRSIFLCSIDTGFDCVNCSELMLEEVYLSTPVLLAFQSRPWEDMPRVAHFTSGAVNHESPVPSVWVKSSRKSPGGSVYSGLQFVTTSFVQSVRELCREGQRRFHLNPASPLDIGNLANFVLPTLYHFN